MSEWRKKKKEKQHSHGILFSSFMNLFFSLEKASSFSPVPGPAMLVVLEPAVDEKAEVGAGAAAASASLLPSLMVAMLGSQAVAGQVGAKRKKKRKGNEYKSRWSRQSWIYLCVFSPCDRCMSEAESLPRLMTELTRTVWAAAGSAWVNISWGPEWIGQHSEFKTKLLTHRLNSILTLLKSNKVIITAIQHEPCTTGLIILCFHK